MSHKNMTYEEACAIVLENAENVRKSDMLLGELRNAATIYEQSIRTGNYNHVQDTTRRLYEAARRAYPCTCKPGARR